LFDIGEQPLKLTNLMVILQKGREFIACQVEFA
jgi:hypothetical protein